MINFKLYEDGPRTILVFENTTVKVKEIIKNIITSIVGEQPMAPVKIANVVPLKIEETKAPDIAALETRQGATVPEIDIAELISTKGFLGYCEGYEYFARNRASFTPEQTQRMLAPIYDFTGRMRNTNIEAVPEEEIVSILRIGSDFVFKNKIPQILQQSGYATLEDFLASGRRNLEDAYLALIA